MKLSDNIVKRFIAIRELHYDEASRNYKAQFGKLN